MDRLEIAPSAARARLLRLAARPNVWNRIASHWTCPLDRAPEISIVVCSNGRREGLTTLFDSFTRLALPESGAAEAILVDNSPAGDTQAKALLRAVDVAPTVLRLLNVAPPADLDGHAIEALEAVYRHYSKSR